MLLGRLVVGWSFLAGLSAVAWANLTPPPDPDIGFDIGDQSSPFNLNSQFQTVNGGGVSFFFNPTNGFITEVAFQVAVNAGTFNCFNDPQNGHTYAGFFLNCSTVFDNGLLTITFFGTNPPGEEEPPGDTEQGEHEGIPPLLPGCLATPDADGCNVVGHFGINLNDAGLTTGSWDSVNPNPGSPLVFTTTSIQVNGVELTQTPEPSTMLPLAGACLLIAIFGRRRLRHRTTAP
jgi:hypothetical protein